jgi:protein-tyrosine phosphatase
MLYQNQPMAPYNFGPASVDERIVFGAQRPGYPDTQVDDAPVGAWIEYLRANGIRRVCCLLNDGQLVYYTDLLGDYRRAFGAINVCHAPIEDFQLCDAATLTQVILPFLAESDGLRQPVVVHCSAGSGRTGHVLAAWLVHHYDMSAEDALRTVRVVPGTWRNPLEAVDSEERRQQLDDLLKTCRHR